MEYFVSGIGTDVGKTIVSALLCEALQADYWKPVQSGDLDNSDSKTIRSLISDDLHIFDEAYRLTTPASPHFSAEIDGVRIELAKINLPVNQRPLIIEGAGGLHVPLNNDQTILDLLMVWDIPVILVSRNYLGSINHTLLSIEVLQQRGIPIAGVVFNGTPTPSTEEIIAKYSGITVLGHIPEIAHPDKDVIRSLAIRWREKLTRKLDERHPMNVEMEKRVRLLVSK